MSKLPTTRMSLAALPPHPLQAKIYTPCSEQEDRALAEDLRLHGQRTPIVIMPVGNKAGLPANTILDGHRRVQAMLAIGQTGADVLIREDLKDADEATVTAEFLKYNLLRRQLHPLDRARVAQHLLLLKAGMPLKHLDNRNRDELRNVVGKALGMSGRNLDRYLCVLETPLEIQTALRDGKLNLVPASRIAMLSEEDQQEIVRRIAGLSDRKEINDVVAEFIEFNPVIVAQKSGKSPAQLVLQLTGIVRALEERIDGDLPCTQPFLPALKENVKVIQKIIKMSRRQILLP